MNDNILYLITARGGSKGIPGKNIKPLAGKPLLLYTIECARKLAGDSAICLSTDSSEIIKVAQSVNLHVPFVRPAELATDTAGSDEVIRHALEYYKSREMHFDVVVLLQPTSPFRKPGHIREALQLFTPGIDMVVSVKEASANPYYTLFEEEEGFLVKSKQGSFKRRQDCPKVFELNGAVYVINVKSLEKYRLPEFKKVRKYVMDEFSSVDIDTALDWEFCEFLMKYEDRKPETEV